MNRPSRLHARIATLRQLEILLAVEQTGSIGGAARKMHLTQPTVSMQMKKLSDAIERHLREREVAMDVRMTIASQWFLVRPRQKGISLIARTFLQYLETEGREGMLAELQAEPGGRSIVAQAGKNTLAARRNGLSRRSILCYATPLFASQI